MRLLTLSLFTLPLLLATAGCSRTEIPSLPTLEVPFVHKIDIQQGNVVTQDMVAQLRAGMNKKKVRFVMGTPIVQDTFHANRWDYIYTYHTGGGGTERRLVSVTFNDDGKLIGVQGDIKPALGRLEVERHHDTSVQVPGEYEQGLMSKLKDSMPFTGDDEPEKAAEAEAGDEGEGSGDEEAALTAEAEEESVTVPGGAPPEKKKGFFKRLVDAIGIGAEEDEEEEGEERAYDPNDPKYRDITNPDTNP
jgi:outer membrane protein assembly factor BamE